jgi:hypothetical protein
MKENLRQLVQDLEGILKVYDDVEKEMLDPYTRGKIDSITAIQRRLELILITDNQSNIKK